MKTRTLLLASAALTTPLLHAQNGTWNVDADGSWNDSANWLGNTIADGIGSTAFLTQNITAARTITPGADRTIGNITFTPVSNFDLTVTGGNILTLDVTTGAPVVNVTQSGRTLTIGSEITGNDGLTKSGPGNLTLTGANTYTGTTTVSGGTLNLGGGTATGSLASSSLVLNGATFNFSRTGTNTQSFTSTTIGQGASTFTAVSTNTIQLGTLSNSNGGTMNLPSGAGTYQTTTANTNGMIAGWLTFNNQNFAFNNAGTITGGATYTATTAGMTAAAALDKNLDVAGSHTMGAAINANSVRFAGVAARTLTLTGVNTLQSGGVLVSSAVANNLSTITGGSIRGSASGALYVHQHNTSNSLTIASQIVDNTGATAFVKAGGGNANLTNTNSFTGKTYVNAGTLSFTSIGNVGGGNSALGAPTTAANGVIEIGNNATLTYTGASAASSNRGLNLTGTGSNTTLSNNGAALTLSGNVTGSVVSPGAFLVRGTGNITLDGVLSFTGALSKTDGGVLTLTNSSNSFDGPVTISVGTISANSIADSGANSALGAGSQITLGNPSNNFTSTLQFTGASGGSSNRAIQIRSNGANTNGGIIENTVAGQTLTLSGTITSTGTNPRLTLTGEGNGVLGGDITTVGGLGLIKNGNGTWTVSGTNSNTGPNTVSAGTLLINGSTSTGTFTVNGGTLGGTGSIGGSVSVAAAGTLSPGASIQSLAAASLTMASGSTFAFEIADNSATGADLLAIGSTVSLTGVNLSLDVSTLTALGGTGWNMGDKITLLSYLGPDLSSGFTGYADDSDHTLGSNVWRFDYNDTAPGANFAADAIAAGQNRFVTFTVVPEPGTALLGGLGILTLLRRRRRH